MSFMRLSTCAFEHMPGAIATGPPAHERRATIPAGAAGHAARPAAEPARAMGSGTWHPDRPCAGCVPGRGLPHWGHARRPPAVVAPVTADQGPYDRAGAGRRAGGLGAHRV